MSQTSVILDASRRARTQWPPLAPDREPMRPPGAGQERRCEGRAQRTGQTAVTLNIHSDLGDVAAAWRAFEEHADCTVFQAYHRLSKWLQHIGVRNRITPAIVTGADPDGELLFIFPLAIEKRRLVRRLTWLGSDLSDYNAPLISRHFTQQLGAGQFRALWREILARLRADARFRFDAIDLRKMPGALGTQPNPFTALPLVRHPSGAYLANLGDDWEKFYASKRSPATRKRERRQLRQLSEHGEVRFVEPREREEIERTLETLFAQKAQAFARMGVEDVFARPGHREFFHDLATDPVTRELIHISRLDVGGAIAAANISLKSGSCYSLVLSSYGQGDISRFGPGRAHLHELIRHTIDRGFRQFDFTIGNEPYKLDWCDTELELYDHLAATTLRGWPVVTAMAAFRRAKRGIKQSPALWHAFIALRGARGWRRPR